jgi:hypothetical protein
LFEKIVTVTRIQPVQKMDSGELMYQVQFTEAIQAIAAKSTNEKVNITVPAAWLILNVETKTSHITQ